MAATVRAIGGIAGQMEATARVSIVMPVYNGERYLAAALDSVLAQEFQDFELICIDDGSTDTTPAILARYAAQDWRVRHLANSDNIGLPATLNRGFAIACGKYHGWTSDDNLLRPKMLSTLVAVLDADADIDVAYAGYSVIDEAGQVLRYQKPKPVEERWFGNPVGAAFLYRREVTETLGGYDETLFGAEDYDFWLRAARTSRFKPINRDLYLYRRHGGSLTSQRSAQIKDMVVQVVVRELSDVVDAPLRAEALLNLVLTDNNRFRPALVGKAFAASPATLTRKLPLIFYQYLRVLASKWR